MAKEKSSFLYKKNSYYHLYNRGNHKEKIFYKDQDYKIFYGLMYKYLKKSHLLLVAYCFMPNHYHFVLKCGKDETEITKFMRSFMTAYVMYFNRKYLKVGHLFQGPFQARKIKGVKDLNTVINYIKDNPEEDALTTENKETERYKWLYIKGVNKR